MKTYSKSQQKVLELHGNIQQEESDELEQILSEMYENGDRNIVIDLSGVQHICSSALGILVTFKKILQKDDAGQLQLVIPSEELLQLFEITMLNKVFDIAQSMNEALNS